MEIAFISTSSSSVTPQCLTSSSRNPKFPMSSARAICNYQKVHPCSVVHTVAFLNNDSSRCTVVSKCSPEISEMNALLSKEKSSNKLLSPFGALATSTMENVIAAPLIGDEKIGVLLLNLGGPETLEDVQPFLFNLFADPDIIRLPRFFRFLQKPLAQFISVLRAPKSREGYSAIGGGSPLRKITDAQAEELRKSLCSKDVPAKVYVGMRYWHPFTEEAIEQELQRERISFGYLTTSFNRSSSEPPVRMASKSIAFYVPTARGMCKGDGVNLVDHFNGQFKAGGLCWLCRGKREILCGNCNGAGFCGGFMSTADS